MHRLQPEGTLRPLLDQLNEPTSFLMAYPHLENREVHAAGNITIPVPTVSVGDNAPPLPVTIVGVYVVFSVPSLAPLLENL